MILFHVQYIYRIDHPCNVKLPLAVSTDVVYKLIKRTLFIFTSGKTGKVSVRKYKWLPYVQLYKVLVAWFGNFIFPKSQAYVIENWHRKK